MAPVRRLLHSYRSSFTGLPRKVWLLCFVMFVHRSGAMVLPFLGLYLTTQQGFSLTAAGRFLATFGLGAALGIVAGGRWTDRFGVRPVILTSLFSSGVFLVLLGQVEGTWPMLGVVFLAGFTSDALRPAVSTAIAAMAPEDRRPAAYGLLRLAINAALSFGPLIGGFLARYSYQWLFWIDGLTAISAGLLVVYLLPDMPHGQTRREDGSRSSWAAVLHDGVMLRFLFLCGIQALIFFQIFTTLPLFLERERGFAENVIGIVLATNTILIVLTEVPLVHAFRSWLPLRAVALASLFLGLGFGLLPIATTKLAVMGTVVLWTIGEMLAFPIAMSWISSRAPEGSRGRVMAAFALSQAIPGVAAPAVGTWVYQNLGGTSLWLACFVLGVGSALGFRLLARHDRPAPAGEEQ